MTLPLRSQIIHLEQQFLLAVARGDEALQDFYQEWSQLASRVKVAKNNRLLDDETNLLVSRVSRVIEVTVDYLLQSEAMLQDAQSCLMDDLARISPGQSFVAVPHPSSITPYHLLFSGAKSSSTPNTLGQYRLLDTFAYRWLLRNIHNPYPSDVELETLSEASSVSIGLVESWFQEARESVKWAQVCRDFFADSPDAAVAAAKRVYLESDDGLPFDVVFAFTVVKSLAETLFAENPALQEKAVGADWDESPQGVASGWDHRSGSPSTGSTLDSEIIFVPLGPDNPTTLSDFSDSSSDSDYSELEDTTPPPPVAGRKRLLDEDMHVLSSNVERPQKRLRYVVFLLPTRMT
ncbi:hypothetical protein BC834DRAFT_26427 [Gloeopeniophorella convolvens]|nr:hypothetical protein BC834DRAFT_26427 [Gloeopeniophorella convolvens]